MSGSALSATGPSDGIRVAIDARTLQDRPIGGVGRFIAQVLPHLTARASIDVLLDHRRPEPLYLPAPARRHHLRTPLSARGFAWLQFAVPSWLRGYRGIFHCPFYGLPYRQPVPMVVTIADLTFEFAPAWQTWERNLVFRRQARWAARTARRIIVHSDHVKAMVLERYGRLGVAEDRLLVVPIPVDPGFTSAPEGHQAALARLGLSPPYVVALGGAPRRQLEVAVAAWAGALRLIGADPRELPLLVVGCERPRARDGVLHAGSLADRDWAAVLAGASAFCYATLYEGYGIPAIEAGACGTPVVCAPVGALPELLGDAAAWSEVPDAEGLGRALARVLGDPEYAETIASSARERVVELPGWEEVAVMTLTAYRDASAG